MTHEFDLSKVGQGQPQSEPVDAHDAMHGEYADPVEPVRQAGKHLQETQMPKGVDPTPFALGPITRG